MELPLLLLACYLFFFVVTTTTAREITDACASQANDFRHLNSTGVHLTLHHPQSPCSPAPLPSDLPFSAIIANDAARIARLTAKTTSSRHDNSFSDSVAATVPLAIGNSVGVVGNYVTRLGLGTPATLFTMVVDTGSSLTWLQCSPCMVSCQRHTGPLYDPQASSTSASVTCSAPQCGELQATTSYPSNCSTSNVCKYHAGYGDGTFSFGSLGKDTVSFSSRSFPGFYYGCGQNNKGSFGQSAGIMGLGRSKLSIISQLAPTLGFSFSYCLPTPASAGYLSIGPYNQGQYSYTPLLTGEAHLSHYFVSLTGMSVGGRPLAAVSSSDYSSLPTVMDSGSVITVLPTGVYMALSKALAAAMGGTPRAPADPYLSTCFKGQASNLRVPAVDMTFAGGATLKLAARNVLHDVDGSKTCLAFAATESITIIGNKLQQTFSVVYDVARSRIGFAAGGCS